MNGDLAITTQELRTSFVTEAGELLDALGDQLPTLAAKPEDPALLNAVFRTFHSIKGGAGFAGADSVLALCHRAEELLDAARTRNITLTDACFGCLERVADALETMLQAIVDGAAAGCPDPELLWDLDSLCRNLVGLAEPSGMTDDDFEQLLDDLHRPHRPPEGGAEPPAVPRLERRSSGRVEVRDLDALVDVSQRIHDHSSRLATLAPTLAEPERAPVDGLLSDIRKLEAVVAQVCLQPIGALFARFERTVRGLARTLDKEIVFDASGGDVRVPRAAMDALAQSVMHVIRNAADHGIEMPAERMRAGKPRHGHISLRVAAVGGEVQVGIVDDGNGMNADRLRARAIEMGFIGTDEGQRLNRAMCLDLVFLPGFTTRAKPSDVSGRGVGLDVVRLNLRRIGGSAFITSCEGLGTTVWIYIPQQDPFPSSGLDKAIESWTD
jgi:two-component system chemotaxis sensor kinase CheA